MHTHFFILYSVLSLSMSSMLPRGVFTVLSFQKLLKMDTALFWISVSGGVDTKVLLLEQPNAEYILK